MFQLFWAWHSGTHCTVGYLLKTCAGPSKMVQRVKAFLAKTDDLR